MLAVFDLVCYASAVPDMITLFKVCRDFWSISKRERLWATLLRRDFPNHAEVVPPGCQRAWFCDLYQYGAYFGIDSHIHLWPHRSLYKIHFNMGRSDLVVMTARSHETFKDGLVWVRTVGVNYVGIASHSTVKQDPEAMKEFENLVKTPGSGHSKFGFAGKKYYFTRLDHDMNGALARVLKYDASTWDDLVKWLHEHFAVTQIVVGARSCDFRGRLRKRRLPEFDYMDSEDPPRDPEVLTLAMSASFLDYSVGPVEDEDWDAEISCPHLDLRVIGINGTPVPFREPEVDSDSDVDRT